MKTKSILVISLLVSTQVFSQNISNLKFSAPIINNPAFTGIKNDQELNLRFSHFYGYNSLYGDFNQYSKKLHGGIGIFLNSGAFNSINNSFSNLGVSYAYQNKLNENWNFSVGTSLQFSANGYYTNNELTTNFKSNVSFGGLIYTDKFYTSLSANDLNSHYPNYNLGFGYEITPFKTKELSFTPSVNFKYINLPYFNTFSADVNLAAKYKNLSLGIGYNSARITTAIGYEFERFKINYSFGNIQNAFSKYNSHEFSFQIKLNNDKHKATNLRFNPNIF